MKLDEETEIVQVKAKDSVSGQEWKCEVTNRCAFLGKQGEATIKHGEYDIQLRFDCDPLDPNGNPILDADVWRNGKLLRKRKTPSHWTFSRWDDKLARYVYPFEFRGLGMVLVTNKTVQKNLKSETVILADSVGFKLNGKEVTPQFKE